MTDTWVLYQTTNLLNGKIYVGVHRLQNTSTSRHYLGSGNNIKAAIKKYGKESFIRATLAEFSCAADAYLAEAEMVTEEFVECRDTYNLCVGGDGGVGYKKGITLTPEHKAKISAARKGKTHTEEAKARISAASKGRVISEETRAKLSKKCSEEKKAKISAALKGHTYNLGRHHSEEAKAKMSNSHKGKTVTAETRAKLSYINKGNKYSLGCVRSEETRANLSAALKGRIVTDETRAKISAFNKGKKLSNEHKAKLSKAVIINGKYYISITKAAEMIEVLYTTLNYRIKSPFPKWVEWRFATEQEITNFSVKNLQSG